MGVSSVPRVPIVPSALSSFKTVQSGGDGDGYIERTFNENEGGAKLVPKEATMVRASIGAAEQEVDANEDAAVESTVGFLNKIESKDE